MMQSTSKLYTCSFAIHVFRAFYFHLWARVFTEHFLSGFALPESIKNNRLARWPRENKIGNKAKKSS